MKFTSIFLSTIWSYTGCGERTKTDTVFTANCQMEAQKSIYKSQYCSHTYVPTIRSPRVLGEHRVITL
jgi:hypothetical protein